MQLTRDLFAVAKFLFDDGLTVRRTLSLVLTLEIDKLRYVTFQASLVLTHNSDYVNIRTYLFIFVVVVLQNLMLLISNLQTVGTEQHRVVSRTDSMYKEIEYGTLLA